MRIELTWSRPDAADRTLTFAVPANLPISALLRHTRRACNPATLERALRYAEPFLGTAASAAGMGALGQLALPVVVRMARQSLDSAGPGRVAPGPAGSDAHPA